MLPRLLYLKEDVHHTNKGGAPMAEQQAVAAPSYSQSLLEFHHHLVLYEIGQSLCSTRELDRLLQVATERVRVLLDVESSAVILVDEKTQECYFKVVDDSRPDAGRKLREIRFPARLGIAGWVLQEGAPALVMDVKKDPRFYSEVDQRTATQTKSYLGVPLRTKERVLGVLTAVNKRQQNFSQQDVLLCEALASQLAIAVENALLVQELQEARARLREENRYLREEVRQATKFDSLIGESPPMQEVYQLLERILNTMTTVLITGESGTGKELVARAIHAQGARAHGPFIAVNCAAIPETLLEAELFGYERGAFTGAMQRKPGRFELASGGTLFLDEIGEMSLTLQAKLLRVLQEKKIERLGGTGTITVDTRIVAATNRDLGRCIAEGKFRDDLFYRLNVYPIPLPSLRERREDIVPLALHFLRQYGRQLAREKISLSEEARRLLTQYEWPGNIRELENAIERAVILCRDNVISSQELPISLRKHPNSFEAKTEGGRFPVGSLSLAEIERRCILQALEQAHYNRLQASRLLGLSRTQLRTRMRKYGLEVEPTATVNSVRSVTCYSGHQVPTLFLQ